MAIEKQYGELVLAFTTDFDFRWNDRKSGGHRDGGYWQPKPPAGFYALGGIGVGNYDNPGGKVAALCVRAADGSRAPLALPTGFDRIWKDKGSGAERDGSCWRPRPPQGYVALGDVFMNGHDTPPDPKDAICVRTDLTHIAAAGGLVWDDSGTGSDRDFGSWEIVTPPQFVDPTLGLIAAGTYVGVDSHTKPVSDPVLNVLMLPMPNEVGPNPAEPELDGFQAPPNRTPDTVDRVVTVPFTAVKDDSKDLKWKVDNSPFYKIERRAWYTLLIFEHNKTGTEQHKSDSVTVGVTTTQTDTYSVKTGITVSEEVGVSFIEEAKVSVTVSVELGFEHSTSVSQLQSKTVSRDLAIPAQTAAALWVASYSLQAIRADGVRLYVPLEFDVESFVSSQYPPVGPNQPRARVFAIDPGQIPTLVPAE